MEKPFDFKVAVEFAGTRNSELIKTYREIAHSLASVSVRRLLQSIINQKSGHSELLRHAEETASPRENPHLSLDIGLTSPIGRPDGQEDPELGFLNLVRVEEGRQAALYERLRDGADDEETRHLFHSLSEACLKFSGWAKDHLDLRSL